MERLGVYQILGPTNCNDPHIPDYCADYLRQLSQAMGVEVYAAQEEDFMAQDVHVFFIGSGGTAAPFSHVCGCVYGPYVLLTVPAYNSLAASMEILSYLQRNGKQGEIIHGTVEENARRLLAILRAAQARKAIASMRMGAIGEAITLVASCADHATLKQRFGADLVVLEVQELVDEYHKGGYPENEYTRALKASGYDPVEMEKALNVYGAAKRLVEKYGLKAMTLRCFDLLGSIGTTGCLALAILNAEGIPAACEGDTRSMLAMTVLYQLTGQPVFMANPSQLDRHNSEMIFAHCTLPINMPDSYELTTHFESGLGVALAGELAPGPITIFKCDETMERYYVQDAELVASLHRDDLCRTQLHIRLPQGTDYFVTAPISNHHMICRGHWADVVEEFFKQAKSE